ncbi:transporter substrate-binding domain-containing protein [Clostridium sp. LBM24168]
MKKILSILIAVSVITVLFAGCGKQNSGSNSSSSGSTLEKVKKDKKVVLAVDDTYPPMEFRDGSNKLVGFDIDMGTAIGKQMGVKVEFVSTAWDGIFMGLKSKKYDGVLSSVSITDERKKSMAFFGPYIHGGQVISVKQGNTAIKSSKDLNGKVVGVQISTTGEEAAKKIPGVKQIKTYDKITDAYNDLIIGRTDAVVVDNVVANYYKKQKKGFDVLSEKLTDEPFGAAFRLEDKDLAAEFSKAYEALKSNGTAAKISEKWFGTDITK